MYLTGVSNTETRQVARVRADLGLMCQPGNSLHRQIGSYSAFACDNGCYGGKFNPDKWLRLLDYAAGWQERCLFAAVPDRFDPNDLPGNHRATLDLWSVWVNEVLDRGLRPAFVCQNASTPDDVPVDACAVFIGGDTDWKLSRWAWAHVVAAKARGRWAHVGRVNSFRRWESISIFGADSADGTFLKHGSDILLPQLTGWMDRSQYQPHLPMFGGAA